MKGGTSSGGGGQPVEYMQRHIAELTAYINDNNQKYHKNMVTLKEFYEAQVDEQHQRNEELQACNVRLENEVLTLRDLLANAETKTRQLTELLRLAEQREEEERRRLDLQRQKNQHLHGQVDDMRRGSQQEIGLLKQRTLELQQEVRTLANQLAQKDSSIDSLNRNVYELEDKVSHSSLLPNKLEDLQKGQQENQSRLRELGRDNTRLTQQIAAFEVLVARLQAENQALTAIKASADAQRKLEVQRALQDERSLAESRAKQSDAQRQSLGLKLSQAESTIVALRKQLGHLEGAVREARGKAAAMQEQVSVCSREKAQYMSQFGALKDEYQGVVQRLEDALLGYQKKNWQLQEENKDLSQQLQALQELLQQVKALNAIQVHRPQYRQMAEMQLLAGRTEQRASPQKPEPQQNVQDSEWDRLMADIDKISA